MLTIVFSQNIKMVGNGGSVHATHRVLPSFGIHGRCGFGHSGILIPNRRFSIASQPSSSTMAEAENLFLEVQKVAREKFKKEVSFKSCDKDISLAKALFYIAAEDEAFMALHREIDARSFQNEVIDVSFPINGQEWDSVDSMMLNGKNINEWSVELDKIAKEVEAKLLQRGSGCNIMEVLETVKFVLIKSRGFKISHPSLDSKCAYLHSALSFGSCNEILFGVIFTEVFRRLNLTILGLDINIELLGVLLKDFLRLDVSTNKGLIQMALDKMIRLHWKSAARSNRALELNSPLTFFHQKDNKFTSFDVWDPMLRPQELRLALMAAQRLMILEPHKWDVRRDLGMLFYYNRDYDEAIQELSICMALSQAGEEEEKELGAFIKKLHLMRLIDVP